MKHKAARPKALAHNAPVPALTPAPQQAAEKQPAASPPVKSAYTAPATASGMMTGSQPMVQAGSFDGRWQGLR